MVNKGYGHLNCHTLNPKETWFRVTHDLGMGHGMDYSSAHYTLMAARETARHMREDLGYSDVKIVKQTVFYEEVE